MRIDLDALDALEKRATPGDYRSVRITTPGFDDQSNLLDADGRPIAMLLTEWSELFAALRNAAPALIRVAKAAREWRAAYLADGDDEEPPFITKLDIAAGELCDAVRALKGEG